jgi:Rieske 2Fe-2S family protein
VTNLEDRDLCELNQRGVNSPGYVPGPYSEVAESLVLRFTNYYVTMAQQYIAATEARAASVPALAAE